MKRQFERAAKSVALTLRQALSIVAKPVFFLAKPWIELASMALLIGWVVLTADKPGSVALAIAPIGAILLVTMWLKFLGRL